MAPTPQPSMSREQQQALAKARARARVSAGGGMGPTNPMVAQGLAAQREYEAAGSPELPKAPPAPAPRVDLRNVNRAPQTQGPGYADMQGSDIGGQDLQKGIRTIPQHVGNAAIGAVESAINLPADLINSARQADAAFVPTSLDAARNANRMPQMAARVGAPPTDRSKVPMVPTVQAPRIPIADEDQSVSGALLEGLVQYALVRKPLGMAAKGGGIASQLGKDIASTGIAFGGNSGRVSDIIDPAVIPAGPLRDYAIWLKTQPEDSPIMGRLKNMLEDATLSGPLLAPHAVVRGGQAIGNALKPSPVSPPAAAVSPSPTAAVPAPAATVAPPATPPSAPFTQSTIPQPSPGTAQAGTASAGQQPAAGPAVAPTGAGAAQPVINATQVSPGVWQATPHQIKVARDTGKILTRIMRAGGVKDADVRGYLPGAVQRYKSLNDSRVPFAFFLESDLPQHFPQGVAEDVVAKLQGWGRERNASTAPKDPSRSITQNTIKTLRGSQQEFLTKSAEANLFKGSLIGQEDQILKSLRETGKKGYEPVLAHARDAMEGRRVPTPEERAGFEDLRSVLARPVFRDRIPNDVRMTAEAEGLDLLELIERDPVTAAHWLQSNLNKLEDAAEINGRATPASLAYGKMRDDVLAPLKRAAPGYEGALNRYGHDWGAKNAVSFGRGAFTKARSAYDTGQMVRAFKRLGRRQQTVAWKSIRDEFLNEFRGTAEDAAAKLTRMQQEGALDLLEQLGARGKKFADDIRKIAQQENPSIRAIDQGSGSPTHSNQKGAKDARENVQSPLNKAVGALGDTSSWPVAMAGDAVMMANGLPPLLTVGKAATKLVDRFGNPSRAVLGRATEGLYALPKQANALALPAPPKARGVKRVSKPKEPRGPQDLGSLLKQLDEAETNARTRGGPEGKRLLDEIAAERKRLAEAHPANALSTPPRPPVKAGPGQKRQAVVTPEEIAELFRDVDDIPKPPEQAGFGRAPLNVPHEQNAPGVGTYAQRPTIVVGGIRMEPRDVLLAYNEGGQRALDRALALGLDPERLDVINNLNVAESKLRGALRASVEAGMVNELAEVWRVSPSELEAFVRKLPPSHAGRAETRLSAAMDEIEKAAQSGRPLTVDEAARKVGMLPGTLAQYLSRANNGKFANEVLSDALRARVQAARKSGAISSQSGSSKLLAGMGGKVGSQLAPPAAAATFASIGPEGESEQDKWTRMAAAAALAVGVRNLPALKKFVTDSRKGAQVPPTAVAKPPTDLAEQIHYLRETAKRADRTAAALARNAGDPADVQNYAAQLRQQADELEAKYGDQPRLEHDAAQYAKDKREGNISYNTFGGVNAKTADLKLQRIAQDMEKAGASRDQIWKETGWFKGNDGKWRFEIDDSGAKLTGKKKGTFGDVLKNERVGAAYPDVAQVSTQRGGSGGSYIREGQYNDEMIQFGGMGDDARSIGLHEGQHAVQNREGFASGGSPQNMGFTNIVEAREAAMNADDLATFASLMEKHGDDFRAESAMQTLPGIAAYRAGRARDAWEAMGGITVQDATKRAKEANRQLAAMEGRSPRELYDSLAGEVEARNVQTRRDFTPEERRARPPWTTQDVPDDQQIVRYGAGQANSEPPKAGPGQKIIITSGKDDAGKGYTVTAEAYNDRGRMVLSPEWPTNVFDEMHAARLKRAEELLYPDLHRPKPTLVDENYGKPKPPRPEWEVENPKAAAEIGRKVAERFVGLMNADPSPVHVLALKDGVGLQEIGDIIEGAMPNSKYMFIAKDGGEIVVADKKWLRQNPQEYTSERWNYMWPSSVTREGRRYGWKDGRPFIYASDPKPPPTQQDFGGSHGKPGGKEPPGNALKGPPKKPAASRAEAEARAEVTRARRREAAARSKYVMRDNRDEYLTPYEKTTQEAEARLNRVMENDARIKVAGARIKGTVEKTLNSQNRSLLAGVGIGVGGGTGLILGYNALKGEKPPEKPISPKDAGYYWSTIQNSEDAMSSIQIALKSWDLWPDDVDMTGNYGRVTKDALRRWRADRGLSPDAPMSRKDVERLLAGPRGYQDDQKKWRYGDGAAPTLP